ncbi:MAG TPA: calcium-binding protein, partial [Actinomycetota bacterium]|nr:calcium-binding protein [Actinomycetota bacterium]
DDTDVVAVRWATPGTVTRVDAMPEAATTSTTKSHTVTCRLLDGLGFGVGGAICDADIPKGPNKGTAFGAGRGGYLGECTTGPNGYCSFTYESNVTGTDTVRAFFDENLDDFRAGDTKDDVTRTWTSDITTGPCAGLNYGQTTPLTGGGKKFAGTLNDDNRTGTPFRDVFCGFAGVDKFDGGGGNDLALGGSGNDTLLGRKGNDELQGSDGNDNLQGAEGSDKILSGKGNDKTSGGFGNDKVYGEAGIDLVQGFAGDDTLGGGDGADKVKGGSGRDNLAGGSGPDALNGGSGKDRCNGGPGADTLSSC